MIEVKNGQDPYSVIGQYIRDHVSAIEDMIAVIEIDGKTSNELFMVDMEVDGYFIWKSDWYEGEKSVALIDFFPVSEAINPSVQSENIRCKDCKHWDGYYCHNKNWGDGYGNYTPPIKGEDGFCDWAERKEG